jgi:TorA maturation chaperone TorD
MRDPGLSEALRAVGGITELARKIGISQPSISNWTRVPADRVGAVEAATGINRAVLRPDLYKQPAQREPVDEIDTHRAQEYGLLATLLARAPDAKFLARVARLRGDASPLGVAHAALSEAASRTDAHRVEREYFDLFIGLGRGELLPYGSFYLTGFLHERPLQRLRHDLVELGIERTSGNIEPEDHAYILCEVMAGLVDRRFPAPAGTDQRMFERHLKPWMARFFSDLERADAADFYARVGTVGRLFMDIETEAFALPPSAALKRLEEECR